MGKVRITRENIDYIINRLQIICNKYKMFRIIRVLDERNKVIKSLNNNTLGFINYNVIKNNKLKKKKKFIMESHYIKVEKNKLPNDFSSILINYIFNDNIFLRENDYIDFLPFGGFIIYSNDVKKYTFIDKPKIVKFIFLPDFFKGKIIDRNKEKNKRIKEQKDDLEMWKEIQND